MRWARSVTAAMLLGAVTGAAGPDGGRLPDPRAAERLQMVERYIAVRGDSGPATLQAMRTVPRHEFVPAGLVDAAYENRPLPIGLGQTISQPYIVAYQTEVIRPRKDLKVLEVGTGSGYQAAVLAATGARVYTMEIFAELATSARQRLERLGYPVQRSATVTATSAGRRKRPSMPSWSPPRPPTFPPALIEQLKPGGRMVIPVGEHVRRAESPPGGQGRLGRGAHPHPPPGRLRSDAQRAPLSAPWTAAASHRRSPCSRPPPSPTRSSWSGSSRGAVPPLRLDGHRGGAPGPGSERDPRRAVAARDAERGRTSAPGGRRRHAAGAGRSPWSAHR